MTMIEMTVPGGGAAVAAAAAGAARAVSNRPPKTRFCRPLLRFHCTDSGWHYHCVLPSECAIGVCLHND